MSPVVVWLLARGQFIPAMASLFFLSLCQSALGNLAASREAHARAAELAERVGNPPFISVLLRLEQFTYAYIRGEGYGLALPAIERLLAEDPAELRSMSALHGAAAALLYAHAGRGEDSQRSNA